MKTIHMQKTLVVSLFCLICSMSQSALSDINIEKVNALVDKLTSQGPGPSISYPDAAIYLYRNGEVYFYSSGARSIKKDSIVEIASNTKVFTGILLSQMIFSGEVTLETTVNEALGSNFMAVDVQLGDLATHRSGLPRLPDNIENLETANPYEGYSIQRLNNYLPRLKMREPIPDDCSSREGDFSDIIGVTLRPIGQCYNYSNVGFAILGHALAARVGTSYESLLAQRILNPLQLKDTVFTLSESQKNRLVQGYNFNGQATPKWTWESMNPMGGLVSTPREMIKFLIENLKNDQVLQFAQERQSSVSHVNVGLGWHLLGQDDSVATHTGGTYGFTSYMGIHRGSQSAVFLVVNSYNPSDSQPSIIGERILLGH